MYEEEINTSLETRECYEATRSVEAALEFLPGENGERFRTMFDDFEGLFYEAPGSRGSHHYWRGGWMDHNLQMLMYYEQSYRWMKENDWFTATADQEHFTFAEGIEVILAHDLEKPFKYAHLVEQHVPSDLTGLEFTSKEARKQFRKQLLSRYDIAFSPQQRNALRFAEGVPDEDYEPGKRVDKPLAVLVHTADTASARVAYHLPGQYWKGEIES